MRTGGYTLQQSLTPESATIVKQALTLARRRGHAHVTPLHVAGAMMASTTGILKMACLQCHSHPLQCKALELCFNVALNRLPTSAPGTLPGPRSHLPTLSNALVAAFKRAQAHQRRGSVENQQQQSILALEVQVEQLVISILDDPSVSRVMREAGFSSTQVKTNVEQALKKLESCKSQSHQPENLTPKPLFLEKNNFQLAYNQKQVQNDDVTIVLEAMRNKKTKNTVIITESSATAENIVKGVIDKFDKKDVPLEMRFVQFISVPLYTLRNISREDFEVKLVELRSILKTHVSTGVVLYLGDLHWVSEFWSKHGEQNNNGYHSPVEYMIMELSRLICGAGENKRLWLIGTASYKTYAKCKIGRPSLETIWSLSPLTIPVATNLSLSLSLDHCDHLKEPLNEFNWLIQKAAIKNHLNCCSDCLVNFNREAQGVMSANPEFTSTSNSSLPLWLKQFKDENVTKQISDNQGQEKLKYLCTKWNSICNSVHRKPHFLEKIINMSTPSPSSSTSVSSNNPNKSKLNESLPNWPVIFKPIQSPKEHLNFLCENENENENEISKPTIPDLLSNPNSSPNSASSSEASDDMNFLLESKEHNPDNMEILCHALEKKVPWQKDIIPDIVSTIHKCMSGIMKTCNRKESWFCFLGADSYGKETIARELAKILFGSHDNFIAISLSSFSLTRADSSEEECNKKRERDEHGASPFERFLDYIRDNPSRVFFIEDINQFDYISLNKFKWVIENGSFTLPDGEIVHLKDAVIIFSCVNFSASRAFSPPVAKELELQEKADDNGVLDLNIATEDGNESECENGLMDLVDKQVMFKIQVL